MYTPICKLPILSVTLQMKHSLTLSNYESPLGKCTQKGFSNPQTRTNPSAAEQQLLPASIWPFPWKVDRPAAVFPFPLTLYLA